MARHERSSSASSHDDHRRRKRQHDDSSDDDDAEAEHRCGRKKRLKVNKSQRIGSDDFYAKGKEFCHWLRNDYRRPKDFAKLDAKEQRHYFRKFVKAWNKGKLDETYYKDDLQSLQNANENDLGREETKHTIQLSPARPGIIEFALQEEAKQDLRQVERSIHRYEFNRHRKEARAEEQENRATGKDRMLEKRAEQRESNKAMAASREQGDMEFGDDVLMGGSSASFAEAVRRRDASRQNQQKQRRAAEKEAALSDLRIQARKKEDSTMAMFKAMAAARYGS